jgi:hypothetical protein
MANLCINTLMVAGKRRAVEQFLIDAQLEPGKDEEAVESVMPTSAECGNEQAEYSLLKALWPLPPGIEDTALAGPWIKENWGARGGWDVTHTIDEVQGYVLLVFSTAWIAPINWLVNVSGKYPHLQLVLLYSEPGNGLLGRAVAQGGSLLVHTEDEDFMDEHDDEE